MATVQIPYTLVDFNEDLVPMINANFQELADKLSALQKSTSTAESDLADDLSMMDPRNILTNSRGDTGFDDWTVDGDVTVEGTSGDRYGNSWDHYFTLAPGESDSCYIEQEVMDIDSRDYYVASAYVKLAMIQGGSNKALTLRVTLEYQDEETDNFTLDLLEDEDEEEE